MNTYKNAEAEAYRISYLISGHLRNRLSKPEELELDAWVYRSYHNLQLFEDLTNRSYIESSLAMMENFLFLHADDHLEANHSAGMLK